VVPGRRGIVRLDAQRSAEATAKCLRMHTALFVTLLAAAAITPGQRAMQNVPPPMFGPATPAGYGYYLMQGKDVISAPFPTAPACYQALEKLKSTLKPGTNTVVCAHRIP
jgi:hypothetical protein